MVAGTTHLVLGLALTWPLPLHLSTHFLPGARGDQLQFMWDIWWIRHAIVALHEWPLFCSLQYHPTGVSLALQDLEYFWSLVGVPLQSLGSPHTLLNLFLLMSFPLNGLAAYRLAREIPLSRSASWVASVLFAFSPYFAGRLWVGHLMLLGAFFVPLFFLQVLRYVRQRSRGAACLAGVYWALTAWNSYYYGAGLALVVAVVAALVLRAEWLRAKNARRWRELTLDGALLGGVLLVMMAPMLFPAIAQLARGDYVNIPMDYHRAEFASADLTALFLPDTTPIAEWWGWRLLGVRDWAKALQASYRGSPLEHTVYLGWVAWAAVGFVLVDARRRALARPWLVLALGALVLSLGPTLFVLGHPFASGLMPARLLNELPLFSIIRAPSRFACFAALGAALTVGIALDAVRRKRVLVPLVLGVGLLEFWPSPLVLNDGQIRHSAFYDQLAERGSGAVLDIPVDYRGSRGGGDVYLYAQTIHHRPIVGGYVSREPTYVFEPLESSPYLRAVEQRAYRDDKEMVIDRAAANDLGPMLRRFGIETVILHKDLMSAPDLDAVSASVSRVLGAPTFEDAGIRAYAVPVG